MFANFFPYKKAEPFLANEFEFTKKHATSITVCTLYGKAEDSLLKNSDSVVLLHPILDAAGNKMELFLKGKFNLAPFGFHLKELFSKALFFSPKKFYWFYISALITRIALSSEAFKEVIKKIENSKEPVLYFYWGDNLAWTIPYLKRKIKNKNLKIVLRLHGSDLYENVKANYAPLREDIFSAVDLIVPISENGKSYLAEKYPDFKNKLFSSRLGVFDSGLNPLPQGNTYHLISVSNMVALKRIHLIFEALQKTTLKIVWHHFGDGPLANELKELIKTKRNDLEIEFHGHVSNQAIIDFYKKQPLNLFLNVSSTEGLPVSIMEALSFGVPVAATNVGGTSELV
ncbi:MAG: glycosyltransferase, partial [Bacteroidia bacterium]